jgi:hypothetical protein
VVNDLTVPNSTANNDIEVNVFVSMCDDFEVYDPNPSDIQDLTWFKTPAPPGRSLLRSQAGEENHPDADLTKSEDEPMKLESSQVMAPTLSYSDCTDCVYYADPVTSFRQALKRYNYHSAITTTTLSVHMLQVHNSDFPYYRGYAPGAVHLTSSPSADTPYNFCKMTLLNYLTPAFVTRRGGIRWKYARTGGNTIETSIMMITRDAKPTDGYGQVQTIMKTQGGISLHERVRQAAALMPHTWSGSTATCTRQNPVVEAEIPFYTNIRFVPAKYANITGSLANFKLYHWYTTILAVDTSDSALTHCFVSVGEDFTLGFFTGAPVAYRVPQDSDPPAEGP